MANGKVYGDKCQHSRAIAQSSAVAITITRTLDVSLAISSSWGWAAFLAKSNSKPKKDQP